MTQAISPRCFLSFLTIFLCCGPIVSAVFPIEAFLYHRVYWVNEDISQGLVEPDHHHIAEDSSNKKIKGFKPGEGVSHFPMGMSISQAYESSFKSKGQKNQLFAIVANSGTEPVCLKAASTKFPPKKEGIYREIKENGHGIYLKPNEIVQLGKLARLYDENGYNGRIYALAGCDKKCEHCPGPRDDVFLLAEWTLDSKDAPNGRFWSDISAVDGLNTRMDLTVMSGMKVCSKRSCSASFEEVKQRCPAKNFWHEGVAWGCLSDCKLTGQDEDCGIAGGETKVSSQFFMEMCPYAYAFSADDRQRGGQVMADCANDDNPHALIVEVY